MQFPDSAILYRELGGVERQRGNTGSALEHFRKAIALEPPDARSLVQIGEILEGQNDSPGPRKPTPMRWRPSPTAQSKPASKAFA